VSWREISIDELDNIMPVSPPIVNKKIKPKVHKAAGDSVKLEP
jgi:hypothetical protein